MFGRRKEKGIIPICLNLFTLCLLASAVNPIFVSADNKMDKALSLADYFFNSQNYNEAITEYKRYIFINPDGDQLSYAHYKIGIAYRNQEKWTNSLDAIRKSINTTLNDSLRDERRVALGIVLIASGNYSAAELELLRVSQFSSYPFIKRKAAFFLCVSHSYTFKWEDAQKVFKKYLENRNNSVEYNLGVDSLFSQAQRMRNKSPGLAKKLSTFIPGSGQFYVGEWRNGVNALVINSATGYFLVNALLGRRLADALLNYLFLFNRYYQGNRHNAYTLAQKRNKNLNQKEAKKILQKLSESLNKIDREIK
jgi:tetratricopeptide (TPR) repeat protein